MISQKQFNDLAEQVNAAFARMGKRVDELEARISELEGAKTTKPKPVKSVEPPQTEPEDDDILPDEDEGEPPARSRRSRRERQTA